MRPIVQCTTLGNFGRFGNQLFQYAFARAYAERYDAVLEVPDWVGRRIFHLDDAYPSCTLPNCGEDCVPWGKVNIDLWGYFQGRECQAILSRATLRQWFRIRPELEAYVTLPERPYIAAHLRRGDYATLGSSVYCVVSRASYLRACEQYALEGHNLIWVSEEEPRPFPDPRMDFLADFIVLSRADVLLRANSSFSYWAGLLSDARVYSPIVDGVCGEQDVPFVAGNWPRLLGRCDTLEIPD